MGARTALTYTVGKRHLGLWGLWALPNFSPQNLDFMTIILHQRDLNPVSKKGTQFHFPDLPLLKKKSVIRDEGFPGGSLVKNLPAKQGMRVGKIPWRKTWQPTPVFLLGKFHEQRSLGGYRAEHYFVAKQQRHIR